MIRFSLILVPLLFSAALAKFYIQELKPSSGNVQDVKHYKDALNILRYFISKLELKALEDKDLTRGHKSNSHIQSSSQESEEFHQRKLIPVRTVHPVKVYNEEKQPLHLVPYKKFGPNNEESEEAQLTDLVPDENLSLERHPSDFVNYKGLDEVENPLNFVRASSLRPVKVYSDEEPSNLEANRETSSENDDLPRSDSGFLKKSFVVGSKEIYPSPIRSLRPAKVYSEEMEQSDLAPDNSYRLSSSEREELQPSNLAVLRLNDNESREMHPSYLVRTKVSGSKNKKLKRSDLELLKSLVEDESDEMDPSDLVPIKVSSSEREEAFSVKDSSPVSTENVVPVQRFRGMYDSKFRMCKTDDVFVHLCADSCKKSVHQACRNYRCGEEDEMKTDCERRCRWRYP